MESLKKNFMFSMIYQILLIFLPLITSPYISRVLGVEGMGTYSYHYAVASYFVMFTNLGIWNYGNRCVAEVREDKIKLSQVFSDIYAFKLCVSGIVMMVYLAYCFFVRSGDMISLCFAFFVLSGVLDIGWFYFGLEQFKVTVTRNVIIKLCTVVLMFVLVTKKTDLWKYVLIISIGTTLSSLYLWTSLNRHIVLCRPNLTNMKKHIQPTLMLFIPVIALSIFKIMDKIMLGNMTDMYQSGLYENAERLVTIPMGLINALGMVMLPRMSHLMSIGQGEKSNYYISVSIKLVTIMASAIVFGLMGTSSVLAPVYFGSDFAECAPVINLLVVTVFFSSWANVIRTQYLIPRKMDRIYVISTCCGAACNLFLNMLLIPVYGARGAAIGTIGAECLLMFMQAFLIRKEYNLARKVIGELPSMMLGFVMMMAVRRIGTAATPSVATLALQIVTGGMIYIIGILALFFIRKDEMHDLFLSMLKGFRKRCKA